MVWCIFCSALNLEQIINALDGWSADVSLQWSKAGFNMSNTMCLTSTSTSDLPWLVMVCLVCLRCSVTWLNTHQRRPSNERRSERLHVWDACRLPNQVFFLKMMNNDWMCESLGSAKFMSVPICCPKKNTIEPTIPCWVPVISVSVWAGPVALG